MAYVEQGKANGKVVITRTDAGGAAEEPAAWAPGQ